MEQQPIIKPLTPKQQEARNVMMQEMAEAALQANAEMHSQLGPARGSFIGNGMPAGIYSDGGLQDTNQITAIKHMKEADKAYREIGIVRNVVDIMTDFASEGLIVRHPVPAQERFFNAWLKKTDMCNVTKQLLMGLYKWGNIGLFRFWGKVKPKTKREMMAKAKELLAQGKTQEAVKAFFADDNTFKASLIPIRYACLPPFRIRIEGSVLFQDRTYYYQMSTMDMEKTKNPAKLSLHEQELLGRISPDLLSQMQANGYIKLPKDNFCMFHYKKDCSRLWADPLILPIMDDLRYKKVLRRLDISVAESIINPITIFKLGKTVEGFAPNKEMFQNLTTLLRTPVAVKTLVWSDLIEVEQHFVDAKEIFAKEKYTEVNNDILAGLGISSVLINGGENTGGSQSAAFLSVRTLLERLEDGRSEIIKFLQAELDYITKAMGFSVAPTIFWDQMNLRDEAAEKRILLELLDRKVISSETALMQLGFNREIEYSRKIREGKQVDKTGVVNSVGPFEDAVRIQHDKDPAQRSVDVQRENNAERNQIMKTSRTGPTAGPGRPAGRGDPSSRRQQVKRDTKPQGMGSQDPILIENAQNLRESVENWYKDLYLKSIDKQNLRQLSMAERDVYDKSVFILFSNMPDYEFNATTIENVALDVIHNGLRMNTQMKEVKNVLLTEFRAERGRKPNMGETREIEARAFVICKS